MAAGHTLAAPWGHFSYACCRVAMLLVVVAAAASVVGAVERRCGPIDVRNTPPLINKADDSIPAKECTVVEG